MIEPAGKKLVQTAGLALIDTILHRADLLRRSAQREECRQVYERPLVLAQQAPERPFLQMRLAQP